MTKPQLSDIAIIGMAGLYPGADTMEKLWANIRQGFEAVSDAPPSWDLESYYDPNAPVGQNEKLYCKRGGFIEEFFEFNPMEFGIMPHSLDGSDPEHFLALRVAKEALSHAGYETKPFARERCACVIGSGSYPHRGVISSGEQSTHIPRIVRMLKQLFPDQPEEFWQQKKEEWKAAMPPFTPDHCPGLVSNVLSGRIANRLDLMGPNYRIDGACSSGVLALDAAMKDLQLHRCDMALVGGVQAQTNEAVNLLFCMIGALSRRGHLRPFSDQADGTLLGEGVGMLVIKRLEDAERDGDTIYAVVKGIGLASDGKSQGALTPRLEGEVLATRRAYDYSGIDPATIGLIEAHGTGTKVGDQTEISCMHQVFGNREGALPHVAIGSVKSMISHTIPASAIASLSKISMALHDKVLPPMICENPNPDLGIEQSTLYINTETRPWIHDTETPRRAAVNAFGFGGINTHVILEEYTGARANRQKQVLRDWPFELIFLPAENRSAVISRIDTLLKQLDGRSDISIADLAYTLRHGLRAPANCNLAIVTPSRKHLLEALTQARQFLTSSDEKYLGGFNGITYSERRLAQRGKLAFITPGEGSQYAGMLSELAMAFPEVRRWFDELDTAFSERGITPRPSQILFPATHLSESEQQLVDAKLWEITYAVPSIVAANSALYDLLMLLGVTPDALVGHSTSQDLSLTAGRYFEYEVLENGLNDTQKILLRNRIWEPNDTDDAIVDLPAARLLSVGALPAQTVLQHIEAASGKLWLAMDNCPNQIVICGSENDLEPARAALTNAGGVCAYLPFDRPYHTPLYQAVADRIRAENPNYEDHQTGVPVYSTTTTQPLPDDPEALKEIMISQWVRPVRFRETIERMTADGFNQFLEVGPRGNLSGFVADTLAEQEHLCAAMDLPHRGGIEQLLHALAALSCDGQAIQADILFKHRNVNEVDLTEPPKNQKRRSIKLDRFTPGIKLSEDEIAQLRGTAGASTPSRQPSQETMRAAAPTMPDGLQAYQDTMSEFLRTQEAIANAVMAGKTYPGANDD